MSEMLHDWFLLTKVVDIVVNRRGKGHGKSCISQKHTNRFIEYQG